ncbi:MAG TPA: tyrosine--tRNA ligase [Candidatus Bathyarchaeia archaeon]|nr:tyrosine--tRNA ligase [Candidatus Bathyarchaeia archaeon]
MDPETRLELVERGTEEVITRDELRSILETNSRPRAYWGFEASGLMHIGMGLVCGRKILDMIQAGFDFTIFLADWHSWINNKLGGKLENIKTCGEYFIQCFTALGISPSEATYSWASELTARQEYWERVVRVAKSVNVSRIWRALPIMGRELGNKDMEAAATFYPCMQVADIFELRLDVACAGLDQRKAHALARDVADKLGWHKPTIVHTHLMIGLAGTKKMDFTKFDEDATLNSQISSKMSKSIPESSILIHDKPDIIQNKIRAAYCPPKDIQNNSIIELARHVSFPWIGSVNIERPPKYGGTVTYTNINELESDYRDGKIHPADLKGAIASSLIQILAPVRNEFDKHPELLNKVEQMQITR